MRLKPPAWAERWQTDDLEALRNRFAEAGPHRRQVTGRGPLRYSVSSMALGRTLVGWGTSSLGQKVQAVPRTALFHLPLSGRISYRVGNRHLEAGVGQAVFLEAGAAYELAYGPGRWLAIQLGPSRLEARLRARRAVAHIRSRETSVSRDDLESLARILHSAGEHPPDRAGCAKLETHVIDWLAGVLVAGLGEGRGGRQAAARLDRLEDWIDEHLAEPLALGRLCEVAGIDARGLQKSFIKWRGVTPMQWVRARRMVAARMRLMQASPGDTVTVIALRCGFPQLGRFAVAYRKRYGESPGKTLEAATAR